MAVDLFSAWLASYDIPMLTGASLLIDALTQPILLVFLFYLFFIKKDRKRALIMGAACLILLILIPSLKFAFSELRPCSAPWKIQCPSDYALPSGHAAAMAIILIAYLSSPAFPIALIVYILVSLSRIYLGVHVLKDVIGGTVIAFAVYLFIESLILQRSVLNLAKRRNRK